ncbi:hypothetical protein EV361DRAFT_55523 [Lentinula raphanica]|nr:hypothetical protein EV361DRAFT_55523 [Lentinula raphanica]
MNKGLLFLNYVFFSPRATRFLYLGMPLLSIVSSHGIVKVTVDLSRGYASVPSTRDRLGARRIEVAAQRRYEDTQRPSSDSDKWCTTRKQK